METKKNAMSERGVSEEGLEHFKRWKLEAANT
jgi:hypothetical protein